MSAAANIIHKESHIKLYSTTNYDMFKDLPGNRNLVEKKINALIKDFDHGIDLLCHFPIMVSKEMYVLDGQHRLFAARRRKKVVFYTIREEPLDLHKIAVLNSRVDRWVSGNFLNLYMKQGIQDYHILNEFIDKYKIKIGVAMQMLTKKDSMHDGGNHSLKRLFESGQFRVTNFQKADEMAQIVTHHFGFYSQNKTRTFISMLYNVYEKYGKEKVIAYAGFLINNKEERDSLQSTNPRYYLNRSLNNYFEN